MSRSMFCCQMLGEREQEVKRLQERLTETEPTIDSRLASQASQSQSSDGNTSEASLQEELAKLTQEVCLTKRNRKRNY